MTYTFADIILRLEWLTTCSDLEMMDGDTVRDVINEVLPSIRNLKREMEKKDKRISDYGWAVDAAREREQAWDDRYIWK